jgi:hypothetical protein
MALPEQVKLSVNAANESMRDALAFTARRENPILISAITDIIAKIESLHYMDIIADDFAEHLMKFENGQSKKS